MSTYGGNYIVGDEVVYLEVNCKPIPPHHNSHVLEKCLAENDIEGVQNEVWLGPGLISRFKEVYPDKVYLYEMGWPLEELY